MDNLKKIKETNVPVISMDINPNDPELECVFRCKLGNSIWFIQRFAIKPSGKSSRMDWFYNDSPNKKFATWGTVTPKGKVKETNYIYKITEEQVKRIKAKGYYLSYIPNSHPIADSRIAKIEDANVDAFRKILGNKLILLADPEIDSGYNSWCSQILNGKEIIWTPKKPSYHQHVNHVNFLKTYLKTHKIKTKEESYNMWIKYLDANPGVLEAMKTLMCGTSHAYGTQLLELGYPHYYNELAGSGNAQAVMAFTFGAKRQYDIFLGIHIASMGTTKEGLWSTNVSPETPYKGMWASTYSHGGKPDHLIKRILYTAWLYGADLIVLEASAYYLFNEGKIKDKWELAPMGKMVEKFSKLALYSNFDRGRPYKPIGLMIDFHHGWTPASSGNAYAPDNGNRKIWGVLDFKDEDYAIDNFFGAIFPGYEKAYSFGSSEGDLVPNRFGDSFEVIMDNASLSKMESYPVIFLLGKPNIDKSLKKKLKDYVDQGGILVLNVMQIDKTWEDFLGVKLNSLHSNQIEFTYNAEELKFLRKDLGIADESKCLQCGKMYEENLYIYSKVKPTKAKVIAETLGKAPLATVNKYGSGKVYLTTPYYMQGYRFHKKSYDLLKIMVDLIGHIVKPHQKIEIEGEPIQHIVNIRKDGLLFALINNHRVGEAWRGRVKVKSMPKNRKNIQIKEYCEGKKVLYNTEGNEIVLNCQVPIHDVRIYTIDGV